MSRHVYGVREPAQGFPRVSGDEPDLVKVLGSLPGFSPRERG